ncbi:MAG: DUF357 domain-containing protein [Candidatus Verstraetearchaeota archaeon]|nr:DUF357 domain-containing protein [Candidatus Verstraetearchaeota archaeon]
MTLEEEARKRLERYIRATEGVFRTMEISPPDDPSLRKLMEESVELSRIYLEDSKHYFGKGDYITALVCIAYSEGIIDAFRNIGWLKYDWTFYEKQG